MRAPTLLLTFLLCVAGTGTPADARDNRLSEFLRNFERLDTGQATRTEWLGSKSPFAPYLDHSVVEALGETERELYGRAFNVGACRVVRMLGTVGFLNAYPYLALALERHKIRAAFEVYILPHLSRNQGACIPSKALDKLPQRPENPSRRKEKG